MENKTPLYHCHLAAGGRMVPFAGWTMPVQYAGVIAEHTAVRTTCGLFDVSHMGELVVSGPDALNNLNHLMTNDISGMAEGQARYSPMCNEAGGVVDDLIIYKQGEQCYFLVVNAGNKDKDVAWIAAHLAGDCTMEDISDTVAQIALQGPRAETILRRVSDSIPGQYYSALFEGRVGDISCMVSRTGYTGEDGFELYCAAADGPALWDLLLAEGASEGLMPCGLGARDTLRLEAAMPLYGHELADDINPYEAGLGSFVKGHKPSFVGKDALAAARFPSRRRVGLEMTGRGIAREGCPVLVGDRPVGIVTSGTLGPFVGKAVALALVETAYKEVGTVLTVDVRGRRVAAKVVPLPFYRRM